MPIVFAIDGDHLYTAVDHKPKSTTRLARLENIAANPQVSVLAQHYNDNWEQLWWVRADGKAAVLESADHRQKAVDLLMAKYAQYRSQAPSGNVIAVRINRLTGWAAADV